MSSEIAIKVEGLSKSYNIYNKPSDRLKQFILTNAHKLIGKHTRKYYKEFWSLKDVTFEVRKGESVGILGRNGSGKSTLLQIISRTLAQTTGSVYINGRVSALLELGAGFNPEFTGRENVYLNLTLHGFSEEQIKNKFDDIAEFADIGEFIEREVKTYSSGMYARLAFAAAIHTEPEVLIVDEILAVGDSLFQQKCINRLYQMLDDGVSLLMVSHDAYQVRSLCKRAILLREGKQILFDSADKVMNEYIGGNSNSLSTNTSRQDAKNKLVENLLSAGNQESKSKLSVSIHNPRLIVNNLLGASEAKSNSKLDLLFDYKINGILENLISFVINIYREDGVYIFGTTTKMQGLTSFKPEKKGSVSIHFPSLPLVSGKYKFRVAINDARGLNILAEAMPACYLTVVDDFKAVGLVDIPHTWEHRALSVSSATKHDNQRQPQNLDSKPTE